MIADRSFDRHNQLTDPFEGGLQPPADGIAGQSVLVNGAFMPHHRVSACRYRLRVLNVSQFQSYNLHLSNGAPMVQIGSDSGLMPRPVRREEILLGPAERAEVIVDFAGAAGESVELRSTPPRRPQPRRRPRLRRRPDAVPGRPRAGAGPDPGPAPAAAAAGVGAEVGEAARRQARPALGDHRRRPLQDHLAAQRQDLQPGPRRRLPGARHDRGLGDRQPHLGRPRDAPAPQRLVPARARRQAAAALGRLPQGDLLRLPRRTDPASPATSPTTPASSSSTATCSTTRTTA